MPHTPTDAAKLVAELRASAKFLEELTRAAEAIEEAAEAIEEAAKDREMAANSREYDDAALLGLLAEECGLSPVGFPDKWMREDGIAIDAALAALRILATRLSQVTAERDAYKRKLELHLGDTLSLGNECERFREELAEVTAERDGLVNALKFARSFVVLNAVMLHDAPAARTLRAIDDALSHITTQSTEEQSEGAGGDGEG